MRFREKDRALYARDPEKFRAKTRKYLEANPGYQLGWGSKNKHKLRKYEQTRRHRELSVDPRGVQAAVEAKMALRPCAACGAPGPSQIDHIVPLKWVDTLPEAKVLLAESWCYQPLCARCNLSKGAHGVWCFVPTGDISD